MVIVIMGVSGSGKTAVGEALATRLGWTFQDADRWHSSANIEKMRRGIPLTDDDRDPWILSLRDSIKKWATEKRAVILACSALRERHRKLLREGASDPACVRFVYLRGTYEEIDRRLMARTGHFMPESLLKSQFASLEEPDPSEALVVNVAQPVSAMVDSIVNSLHVTPSGFAA